ncbi:MAG: hypothetical protein JW795_13365 [Chitinivibrionales bacterium]|nr:hypothetical protein [Chitinivibrionales bacterium]
MKKHFFSVYGYAVCILIGSLFVAGCNALKDKDDTPATQGTIISRTLTSVTVHSYVSKFGTGMMNSHVIETKNSLIIFELQKFEPYLSEFSAYVKSLKKPVSRIYISHTCDCHLGYCDIVDGVPVYALPQVKDSLEKNKDKILEGLKKEFGANAPSKIVVPTKTIDVTEETVDGVKMKYISNPDKSAGAILYVSFPDEKMLSTQHVMYNRLHLPRLTSDTWKTAVDGFKAAGYQWYLAGHGYPGSTEVPDNFSQYQNFARETVKAKKTAPEAIQVMKDKYPAYDGVDLLTMIITAYYENLPRQ